MTDPTPTGPTPTGPTPTGPTLTGPTLTGPTLTGPTLTGPTLTGPTLGLLGVDPDAERLYRLLVRSGPATTAQLAAELGEDVALVVARAGELRAAGLVAALAGADSTFAPVDPRVALRALTDRHSEQLDRIRAQVPVLAELFESARHRGTGNGATVVLADPDAIAATYVRVQHQARSQFLAFDRPPYVSASDNPLQPVVLDRGVSWRAVYAAASFEIPGAWQEARGLAAKGELARVVADLPVKLAIADHDLALVSLQLDPLRVEALRTESRPMVEALCALFEHFWVRGTPVTETASADAAVTAARTGGAVPAADAPGERTAGRRPTGHRPTGHQPTGHRAVTAGEHALLTLIGAGLKDEVIARQLGISTRTLRRRSQELMTELGAANRFQAGAEAARRGWL